MTIPEGSPTPPLDSFLREYDKSDNVWWRIECGHHQNLFEAAVERMQKAESELRLFKETLRSVVIDLELAEQVE